MLNQANWAAFARRLRHIHTNRCIHKWELEKALYHFIFGLGSPSIDQSISMPCTDIEILKTVNYLALTVVRGSPPYDYDDMWIDSAQNLAFVLAQMKRCPYAPKRQSDLYWQLCPLWDITVCRLGKEGITFCALRNIHERSCLEYSVTSYR